MDRRKTTPEDRERQARKKRSS